ncbi:MAG: VWA domain-containing protein [Acidobacteria bacterium]|nr:MAG: VWA domain-containing protein [Acidobacteriota bacterium]
MPPLLLVLLLVLLSWQPAPAATENPRALRPGAGQDTRTLSPYFFVRSDDPSTDRLPLKATAASVDIVGVIARVKVTQVYRNEGRNALEAIYIFPASTRAAVHGMKMTIGERVITARIEERQEARRQYQQALQGGQSASLLEQQRPNVFQMNVANILPGDEIKVELVYSELLVPERGVYEFVYPTVVGPRYSTTDAASAPASEQWVQNPYLRASDGPATTFDFKASISAGMPLKQVTSPSHEMKVDFPAPARALLSLPAAQTTGADRDLVIRYQLADNRIETGLMLYETASGERFFLCLVEPPRRFAPAAVPQREYVFIVDVSGSMNGFPLETTKALFRTLLGRLRPGDSFNVLFFSGGAWVLSPASLPATEANRAWALGEIERQHGGGGTELLPALRQAFDLPRARRDVARTVVIATDGYVNVEREAFALVRNRLDDANVFAFGIGTSVNRHLIEGLARAGEGLPFVVLGPGEAQRAASRFLEYIESPLLTGVEVRTPGFQAYDLEPGRLPDLFAQRPLVLAGKYRGEATGEIVITGFTGEGRFERRVAVDRSRVVPGGEVLKYLWARERLSSLADLAGPGDANAETKQEITRLGLEYGLLTEFTSFVAVDQFVRRQDGKVTTVKQPLPLPQGVSELAVGGGVVGGVARKMSVAAESVSVVGAAPMVEARDSAGRPQSAPGQLTLPVPPPPPPPAGVSVAVLENQARGAKLAPETLKEAVRRAVSTARCTAAAFPAVRLRITFDTKGNVTRVDEVHGQANAPVLLECLRRALLSMKPAGTTGGYVVVEVGWR